jgi:hypothetical protein
MGEGGTPLDALARDLATGAISRRTALKRFAGASLGAMLPGALFAESAVGACPKSRRCNGRCCPNHAHCHRGKCKCNKGYTRCGKHCRNLLTDERNCGSCGHRCPEGKVCKNGRCKAITQQTCGNDVREGTEVCDGNDLNGEDCVSQGFASGTLACANDCQSFDTSGCTGTACTGDSDCPGDPENLCMTGVCVTGACGFQPVNTDDGVDCTIDACDPATGTVSHTPNDSLCASGEVCDSVSGCGAHTCAQPTDCPDRTAECKTATCVGGACQYADNPAIGQPCYDSGLGACRGSGTFVCNGSGGVVCAITVPGATPRAEICGNGIDDDCDGVVDNGCPP